jgi:hypothetical protein
VARKLSGASDGKVSRVDPTGRVKVAREAARNPAGVGVPLTLVVVFILESITVDSGTLSD